MAEIAELENSRFKVHTRPIMGQRGLIDHIVVINPYGLTEELRADFLDRARAIGDNITVKDGEVQFLAAHISNYDLHTLGQLIAEFTVRALPVSGVLEVLRDYL